MRPQLALARVVFLNPDSSLQTCRLSGGLVVVGQRVTVLN